MQITNSQNDRCARFRALLKGDICFHPATVYDPMSGIMAEELGFEAGIFAGAIASLTILASPDRVLMTLSEVADQARASPDVAIYRSSSMAIMAMAMR